MAGTVCGPQYANKKCECRLQVVPGKTPATQEASNPLRICSYLDSEQTMFACDPGCCPTDCSTEKEDTGANGGARNVWWWFVVTILFGLMIASSFVYRSTIVQNIRSRIAFMVYIAVLIITMIIITLVNVVPKKKS